MCHSHSYPFEIEACTIHEFIRTAKDKINGWSFVIEFLRITRGKTISWSSLHGKRHENIYVPSPILSLFRWKWAHNV